MKRSSILVFFGVFVAMLAGASVANAGGFQLFEWGNRGQGMGSANYAVGNEASVIAYNPAQMTKLDGTRALVGATAIAPGSDVNITSNTGATGTGNFETKKQTYVVPHAYLSTQLGDKVWFGVGEFTRYGLGTKYDSNWAGRNLLQEIQLESMSIQPTIAGKFTDKLSVGFGVEILKGGMLLKKAHPSIFFDNVKVDVDGYSVGGTLGVHYAIDDAWSLGFVYRSPMKFTGTGDVQVEGSILSGQHGKSTVSATFPSSYTLGLGYEPTDKLSFEADIIFTRWELFNKMTIDNAASVWAAPSSTEEFYYKNNWRFQLGAEYQALDWLALRAGYVYDQTPTKGSYASVMLPTSDRQLFSLGSGLMFGDWTIDLSAMYILSKERHGLSMTDSGGNSYKVDFKNGRTLVGGVSVAYTF